MYIKEAVEKLKKRYGTSDPYELAECLGISIAEYPFAKIKGVIIKFEDSKLIGVNSNLDDQYKRAVVAHELGHHELSPDSGYFFRVENTYVSEAKEEYKANIFAAELLTDGQKPDDDETIENFAARLGVPVEIVQVIY